MTRIAGDERSSDVKEQARMVLAAAQHELTHPNRTRRFAMATTTGHAQELHRRRERRPRQGETEPVLNPATGEEMARAPMLERRRKSTAR